MSHPTPPAPAPVFCRVLAVNIHKGFAFLSRRFVLHALRESDSDRGGDVVFLQEVQGEHSAQARVAGWPKIPHYEFLADELWPEFRCRRRGPCPCGVRRSGSCIRGLLSHRVPTGQLLAALMVYRVIYTLAPLALAAAVLFFVDRRARAAGASNAGSDPG